MDRRTFVKGAAGAVGAMLAAPAIAQDVKANTLRFVPQANLTLLDPIWTTATVTNNHGYYVYDTLFGADMALKPQPQMVETFEAAPDRRSWRFRLREGLKFHDGAPVRSADCIASIRRWCQRDPFGQLLAKVTDSWTAIDDRTFEVRLARPFPLMIEALAKVDGPAFIMPEGQASTDASKPISQVIGSGPYRFVAAEFNPGSRVVYEKFDGYAPRAEPASRNAGGKVGYFPRIEWHVIPDPSTAANALIKGEVDWWERPTADLHPTLKRSPDIIREVTDTTGRMAIMRFNSLHPPFDKVAVRQAVRLAVKQEDYMLATQGEDTSAWKTCRSLWGRGSTYYQGEQEDLMPQSLDKAKQALQASGYAGEKVVIISPADFPDIGPLGLVTADLLKKMGMNVELVEMDWGSVIKRRSSRDLPANGGWSIFHTTGPVVGWGNPALNYLARGQGDSGWFGWWKSDRAEALTQDWLFALDEAAQKKAAVELGRLALDQAPTVPLGQFTITTAYRKSLSGMLPGSAPYPWGLRRV